MLLSNTFLRLSSDLQSLFPSQSPATHAEGAEASFPVREDIVPKDTFTLKEKKKREEEEEKRRTIEKEIKAQGIKMEHTETLKCASPKECTLA